jgi:hypothetical protein
MRRDLAVCLLINYALSNCQHVTCLCAPRERHGWMADSQVASAPASLNFDMDAFCEHYCAFFIFSMDS